MDNWAIAQARLTLFVKGFSGRIPNHEYASHDLSLYIDHLVLSFKYTYIFKWKGRKCSK